LFLALEGVEGTGKSTQAELLSTWMEELGLPHVLTREPGGTPVGEAIRRVVLTKEDLVMPPETELFLILGARAAFLRDVVRPALEEGKLVLADRFALSTLAYQGFGRGLDLKELRRAIHLATGGLEPDLYLVLDLPVEEGLARKDGDDAPDRIEREGRDFLLRVREGYLSLAREDPRIVLIPAHGDPGEVQAGIREALRQRYPETFPRPGV
jgi:dTMP kinase